jgi:hypothetical protein
MCATLGDYLCPMYKIINFNIAILHFLLFHNVTCYTNPLLSCTNVNTTYLLNITCTLVAKRVVLGRLEYPSIYVQDCQLPIKCVYLSLRIFGIN